MRKIITITFDTKYIMIRFTYNDDIIEKIRSIGGGWWEREQRAWMFTYSPLKIEKIKSELEADYRNNVIFNSVELQSYLKNFIEDLQNRNYSTSTINEYTFYLSDLVKKSKKHISKIDTLDIKKYIHYYVTEKQASGSTINVIISALKYFYKYILKNKILMQDIIRPKRDKSLPEIFSRDEIIKLLEVTENLKHKTIIALIYSSGLRVSEATKLKLSDIDYNRKTIYIKQSKGKKDRITILGDETAKLLHRYQHIYDITNWLFEGEKRGTHLSRRTIQYIVKQAVTKAGIKKNVSVHSLRHSFATHLHESGVDIRIIQELLGHSSTKTTQIYTHISRKSIEAVKSPLDHFIKIE